MRHKKDHSKLNRDKDNRKALTKNLLRTLFTHEKIVTTVAKAKDLRRHSDRLITLGKRGDLHARRLAFAVLQDKELVKKIFDELAPRYKNRLGGYTRVLKYRNRRGDNAPLAVVELVQEELKVRVKRKKIKEERKKLEEEKKQEALEAEEKKLEQEGAKAEVEEEAQETAGEVETEGKKETKAKTKKKTEKKEEGKTERKKSPPKVITEKKEKEEKKEEKAAKEEKKGEERKPEE